MWFIVKDSLQLTTYRDFSYLILNYDIVLCLKISIIKKSHIISKYIRFLNDYRVNIWKIVNLEDIVLLYQLIHFRFEVLLTNMKH